MRKIGRGNRKKHRTGPVLLILMLTVAIVLLAFIGTSYFCVSDIIVNGNRLIDYQEILEYTGIEPGMNILRIKLKDVEERLEAHPFILKTDVKRKIPKEIIITLEERDLIGYIPYMGSYLLVDSEIRVISATAQAPIEGLPVFNGIEVRDFQVKNVLDIDYKNRFDEIVYISQCISENIVKYAPIQVDVADLGDIVIDIDDRFVLRVGDIENLDYKLKFSDTILEKLYPQDVGGEIDVSCGERAFFRPW